MKRCASTAAVATMVTACVLSNWRPVLFCDAMGVYSLVGFLGLVGSAGAAVDCIACWARSRAWAKSAPACSAARAWAFASLSTAAWSWAAPLASSSRASWAASSGSGSPGWTMVRTPPTMTAVATRAINWVMSASLRVGEQEAGGVVGHVGAALVGGAVDPALGAVVEIRRLGKRVALDHVGEAKAGLGQADVGAATTADVG